MANECGIPIELMTQILTSLVGILATVIPLHAFFATEGKKKLINSYISNAKDVLKDNLHEFKTIEASEGGQDITYHIDLLKTAIKNEDLNEIDHQLNNISSKVLSRENSSGGYPIENGNLAMKIYQGSAPKDLILSIDKNIQRIIKVSGFAICFSILITPCISLMLSCTLRHYMFFSILLFDLIAFILLILFTLNSISFDYPKAFSILKK